MTAYFNGSNISSVNQAIKMKRTGFQGNLPRHNQTIHNNEVLLWPHSNHVNCRVELFGPQIAAGQHFQIKGVDVGQFPCRVSMQISV